METFNHSKECSTAVFLTVEVLKKSRSLSFQRMRNVLLKLLPESCIQKVCWSEEQFCEFLRTHDQYFDYNESANSVCLKITERWASKDLEKAALDIVKSKLKKRDFILLRNLHSFFDPQREKNIFKYIRTGVSGITSKLIALLVGHIDKVLICGEKIFDSNFHNIVHEESLNIHLDLRGVISLAQPKWGVINTEETVKIGKIFVDKRLTDSSDHFSVVFPVGTSVIFDCVPSLPGKKYEWQATFICPSRGTVALNNTNVQINEPPGEEPMSRCEDIDDHTGTDTDNSTSSEESSDEKQFLLGKSGTVTLMRSNAGLFEIETIVNCQTELVCCPFNLGKHISVGNSVVFDAESTPESHLYQWKAIKVYIMEDIKDEDDDGTAATLNGGNVTENAEVQTSEVEVSFHIHENTEEISEEQRDINYNIQNGEIFDVKTNYGIIKMNQPDCYVYFDRCFLGNSFDWDEKLKVGQLVKVEKAETGSPLEKCKWTATDLILIQDFDQNDVVGESEEQCGMINAIPVDKTEITEEQIQENENDNVTSELELAQQIINARNPDVVVSCDSLNEDDLVNNDKSHLFCISDETKSMEDDKNISFETDHDTNNQGIHLISQESPSTHYDDNNTNGQESRSTHYDDTSNTNDDDAEIARISRESSSTHYDDTNTDDQVSRSTQYDDTNTNDELKIPLCSQESPSSHYDHDTSINDDAGSSHISQETLSSGHKVTNKNDDEDISLVSKETPGDNNDDNSTNGDAELPFILQESPRTNHDDINTNNDAEIPLVPQETQCTITNDDTEIAHISQESPSPDYDGIDTNDDASSIESTYQPNANLDHLDENENVIVAFINENFVLYYNRLVSFIEEKLNRYPSIKRMLSWFKGECEKLEDWEPYSYSQTVMDNQFYTLYQEKITSECFVAITDTINSCKTSSVIQLVSSTGANQSSVRTFNKEIQTEKYKKPILIDCGTQTSELIYFEDQSVSLLQPCKRNSNCKEAAVQTRSSGAIMSTVFSE